jgi:hypothetical protein
MLSGLHVRAGKHNTGYLLVGVQCLFYLWVGVIQWRGVICRHRCSDIEARNRS